MLVVNNIKANQYVNIDAFFGRGAPSKSASYTGRYVSEE